MDFGALVQKAWPWGPLLAVAGSLLYALIKRGFKVQIEVPPKR